MRNILVYIFLATISLLANCTSSENKGGYTISEYHASDRVSLSTETYVSKTMPFSIQRPSGWDSINMGGYIKAYFDGGDMKMLKVSYEPFPEKSKNGKDAVEKLIKRISGIMDNYKEEEGVWEKFDSRDAFRQTIVWKDKYYTMKAKRLYIPMTDNIYVVSAEAKLPDFARYEELFDKCLKGFEIH